MRLANAKAKGQREFVSKSFRGRVRTRMDVGEEPSAIYGCVPLCVVEWSVFGLAANAWMSQHEVKSFPNSLKLSAANFSTSKLQKFKLSAVSNSNSIPKAARKSKT